MTQMENINWQSMYFMLLNLIILLNMKKLKCKQTKGDSGKRMKNKKFFRTQAQPGTRRINMCDLITSQTVDLSEFLSEYFTQLLLLEVNLSQEMDRHPQLSESGDDSDGSDKSIDRPPYFNSAGAGSKPEEIIQRKLRTFDTFKRTSEELKSEYDRHLPILIGQIKKLNDITDEIESVHKNTTVGSLIGSSAGAFGGISGLVGLALSPFTLAASLSLTAVAAVAVATGGVTSVASIITNMLKQRNLRQTIEKSISDFLEILKPMTEHLSLISNITADIQQNNEILNKLKFQTPVRGFDDILNIVKVADVALLGKYCAEAAKEIRVYVKAVRAVRGSAGAAKAMRAAAGSVKEIRKAAAAAGVFSALFLAFDVASIVLDLIEIFEMNQPANARKAEEIKSQTLKFIHYTRETASQFQETLD